MSVEFTSAALQQLDAVLGYLRERSPPGARNVQKRIRAVVDLLADFPLIGSATSRAGQRRIVVTPYPYVIFYRSMGDRVIVQQILHTARKPL